MLDTMSNPHRGLTRRSLFGLLVTAFASARFRPSPLPASLPIELPVEPYTAQLNGGSVRFARFVLDGFVVERV